MKFIIHPTGGIVVDVIGNAEIVLFGEDKMIVKGPMPEIVASFVIGYAFESGYKKRNQGIGGGIRIDALADGKKQVTVVWHDNIFVDCDAEMTVGKLPDGIQNNLTAGREDHFRRNGLDFFGNKRNNYQKL